ncbi:MAG: MurR/RpiR family transcriptional regulator [Candidatus Moduliflexus flocculans]|nr:MurR/RpiR family transcriptional regulator [Candidatus Moduliflexus flocculans]
MRDTSCLFTIHERLPSMSEKERKVADFILASPQDAVHPSIEALAERIGVSESTLFRFVRKLGYDGYQQFRIALATETVGARGGVLRRPRGLTIRRIGGGRSLQDGYQRPGDGPCRAWTPRPSRRPRTC